MIIILFAHTVPEVESIQEVGGIVVQTVIPKEVLIEIGAAESQPQTTLKAVEQCHELRSEIAQLHEESTSLQAIKPECIPEQIITANLQMPLPSQVYLQATSTNTETTHTAPTMAVSENVAPQQILGDLLTAKLLQPQTVRTQMQLKVIQPENAGPEIEKEIMEMVSGEEIKATNMLQALHGIQRTTRIKEQREEVKPDTVSNKLEPAKSDVAQPAEIVFTLSKASVTERRTSRAGVQKFELPMEGAKEGLSTKEGDSIVPTETEVKLELVEFSSILPVQVQEQVQSDMQPEVTTEYEAHMVSEKSESADITLEINVAEVKAPSETQAILQAIEVAPETTTVEISLAGQETVAQSEVPSDLTKASQSKRQSTLSVTQAVQLAPENLSLGVSAVTAESATLAKIDDDTVKAIIKGKQPSQVTLQAAIISSENITPGLLPAAVESSVPKEVHIEISQAQIIAQQTTLTQVVSDEIKPETLTTGLSSTSGENISPKEISIDFSKADVNKRRMSLVQVQSTRVDTQSVNTEPTKAQYFSVVPLETQLSVQTAVIMTPIEVQTSVTSEHTHSETIQIGLMPVPTEQLITQEIVVEIAAADIQLRQPVHSNTQMTEFKVDIVTPELQEAKHEAISPDEMKTPTITAETHQKEITLTSAQTAAVTVDFAVPGLQEADKLAIVPQEIEHHAMTVDKQVQKVTHTKQQESHLKAEIVVQGLQETSGISVMPTETSHSTITIDITKPETQHVLPSETKIQAETVTAGLDVKPTLQQVEISETLQEVMSVELKKSEITHAEIQVGKQDTELVSLETIEKPTELINPSTDIQVFTTKAEVTHRQSVQVDLQSNDITLQSVTFGAHIEGINIEPQNEALKLQETSEILKPISALVAPQTPEQFTEKVEIGLITPVSDILSPIRIDLPLTQKTSKEIQMTHASELSFQVKPDQTDEGIQPAETELVESVDIILKTEESTVMLQETHTSEVSVEISSEETKLDLTKPSEEEATSTTTAEIELSLQQAIEKPETRATVVLEVLSPEDLQPGLQPAQDLTVAPSELAPIESKAESKPQEVTLIGLQHTQAPEQTQEGVTLPTGELVVPEEVSQVTLTVTQEKKLPSQIEEQVQTLQATVAKDFSPEKEVAALVEEIPSNTAEASVQESLVLKDIPTENVSLELQLTASEAPYEPEEIFEVLVRPNKTEESRVNEETLVEPEEAFDDVIEPDDSDEVFAPKEEPFEEVFVEMTEVLINREKTDLKTLQAVESEIKLPEQQKTTEEVSIELQLTASEAPYEPEEIFEVLVRPNKTEESRVNEETLVEPEEAFDDVIEPDDSDEVFAPKEEPFEEVFVEMTEVLINREKTDLKTLQAAELHLQVEKPVEAPQQAQTELVQSIDVILKTEESTLTLQETHTSEVSVEISSEEIKLDLTKPSEEEATSTTTAEIELSLQQAIEKPETRATVVLEVLSPEDLQPGLQPAQDLTVAPSELAPIESKAESKPQEVTLIGLQHTQAPEQIQEGVTLPTGELVVPEEVSQVTLTITQEKKQQTQTVEQKTSLLLDQTDEGIQPAQTELVESVDIVLKTEESTVILQETHTSEVSVEISSEETKLDLTKPSEEEATSTTTAEIELSLQQAIEKPETRATVVLEVLSPEDLQPGLQPAQDLTVAPSELAPIESKAESKPQEVTLIGLQHTQAPEQIQEGVTLPTGELVVPEEVSQVTLTITQEKKQQTQTVEQKTSLLLDQTDEGIQPAQTELVESVDIVLKTEESTVILQETHTSEVSVEISSEETKLDLTKPSEEEATSTTTAEIELSLQQAIEKPETRATVVLEVLSPEDLQPGLQPAQDLTVAPSELVPIESKAESKPQEVTLIGLQDTPAPEQTQEGVTLPTGELVVPEEVSQVTLTITQEKKQQTQTVEQKTSLLLDQTDEGIQPAQTELVESVDIVLKTEESTVILQETHTSEVSVEISSEETKLDLTKPSEEEATSTTTAEIELSLQQAIEKPETRATVVLEVLSPEDLQPGLQPAQDLTVAPSELAPIESKAESKPQEVTLIGLQDTPAPEQTQEGVTLPTGELVVPEEVSQVTLTITQEKKQQTQTVEQKTSLLLDQTDEGIQPAQTELVESVDIVLKTEESTVILQETHTSEVSVEISSEETKLDLTKPSEEEATSTTTAEIELSLQQAIEKPETRATVVLEVLSPEDLQPGLQPAQDLTVAPSELVPIESKAESKPQEVTLIGLQDIPAPEQTQEGVTLPTGELVVPEEVSQVTLTITQEKKQQTQTVEQKTSLLLDQTDEGIQPAQTELVESVDIVLKTEESTVILQETHTSEVSVEISSEETKLDLTKPSEEEATSTTTAEIELSLQQAIEKPETRATVVLEVLSPEDLQPGLQPAQDLTVAPSELAPIESKAESKPQEVTLIGLQHTQAPEQTQEGVTLPTGELVVPEEVSQVTLTVTQEKKLPSQIEEQVQTLQATVAKDFSPEKEVAALVEEIPSNTAEASVQESLVLKDIPTENVSLELQLTASEAPYEPEEIFEVLVRPNKTEESRVNEETLVEPEEAFDDVIEPDDSDEVFAPKEEPFEEVFVEMTEVLINREKTDLKTLQAVESEIKLPEQQKTTEEVSIELQLTASEAPYEPEEIFEVLVRPNKTEESRVNEETLVEPEEAFDDVIEPDDSDEVFAPKEEPFEEVFVEMTEVLINREKTDLKTLQAVESEIKLPEQQKTTEEVSIELQLTASEAPYEPEEIFEVLVRPNKTEESRVNEETLVEPEEAFDDVIEPDDSDEVFAPKEEPFEEVFVEMTEVLIDREKKAVKLLQAVESDIKLPEQQNIDSLDFVDLTISQKPIEEDTHSLSMQIGSTEPVIDSVDLTLKKEEPVAESVDVTLNLPGINTVCVNRHLKSCIQAPCRYCTLTGICLL